MSYFYKMVNYYYNIREPIITRQVDYKVNQDIAPSLYWD